MTDIALVSLAALGLTAIIQIGAAAYVYGKLSQRVTGHSHELHRIYGRLDDHEGRLRMQGERLSRLEAGN